MLRAVRFAADLGFAIDPATLAQIRQDAPGIAAVAAERIWAELSLVLDRARSAAWVRQIDDLGLLGRIVVEVNPMKGCTQNDCHHLDVWQHSLAVLEKAEAILAELPAWFDCECAAAVGAIVTSRPKRLAFKLAALLHDAAKPAARAVDPASGRVVFRGHDDQGAAVVDAIARRLRLSALVRRLTVLIVANHMHVLFLSAPNVNPATVQRWFRRLGDDMVLVILLSMADVLSALGPAATAQRRRHHLDWAVRAIGVYFTVVKPRLAVQPWVNGKDLMAMGMAPGPRMGRTLSRLRQLQDEGRLKDRQEALAMAAVMIGKPEAGLPR
jgi:tRNA nucleotidyltransferase/poly(A) polymerase